MRSRTGNWSRAFAAASGVCALLAACASLENLSGDTSSADGGGGDATTDASEGSLPNDEGGLSADAGVDSRAAVTDGGNLAQNPGFELGNGGCGATWIPTYGATFLDPTARSGAHSCRLCSVSPDSELPSKPAVFEIKAGAGFHAEAWFKAPLGAPALAYVHIRTIMTLPDGGELRSADAPKYPYATATSNWQLASLDWQAPGDGTSIQIVLIGFQPDDGGNGCLLWDDISLVPSQ